MKQGQKPGGMTICDAYLNWNVLVTTFFVCPYRAISRALTAPLFAHRWEPMPVCGGAKYRWNAAGMAGFQLHFLQYAPARTNSAQRRPIQIGHFNPRSESPDLGHPVVSGWPEMGHLPTIFFALRR